MRESLQAVVEGEERVGERSGEELERARAALAARLDMCWDRLDDVVSELVALHGADPDAIVGRVRRVIRAELA